MAAQSLTKPAMAERMGTSRSALDRLLGPDATSVTLRTLRKGASSVEGGHDELGKTHQVVCCGPGLFGLAQG